MDAWKSVLAQCELQLQQNDPADLATALGIRNLDEFRDELAKLEEEQFEEEALTIVRSLVPALDHYDAFARSFVSLMKNQVETSMMWGLLCLVIQVGHP